MMIERLRQDRGSVLLLATGLVPVLAAFVAVGTDISVLMATRRALGAEVDSAALAAAQSANLAALYTGHDLDALPLDCRAARNVARDRLGGSGGDPRVRSATMTRFTCRNSTVSVAARTRATLPFASHFGLSPDVDVAASASARSPFGS